MHIRLNGASAEIPEPMSVQALLDRLKIDGRTVAVELNEVVVKRAKYGEALVTEDAEVEIVAFVGGGSGAIS
jgi:thiamine biosynthesis protein ThiS